MQSKLAVALLAGYVFLSYGIAFGQSKDACQLTAEIMMPVYRQVKENILLLKNSGRLDTSGWSQPPTEAMLNNDEIEQNVIPTYVRFAWPMKPRFPEAFDYYHISNYVDLDSAENGCVKDYMGGRRTYDGHQGTDIVIGPYHWKRQTEGSVYAVAAQAGIIVEKLDGNYDENCTLNNGNGPGRGNHVVILHGDGHTVSFYMHLKNGSVTDREVGDPVAIGDILGIVASSGNSTAPHLHFQVNTSWSDPDNDKGKAVDPWAGPSNYTTSQSLWLNQKPYDEPIVYHMETQLGNTFDFYSSSCDKEVNLSNLRNSFTSSQIVGMRAFFRDWVDDSKASAGITRPDGTAQATWINIANNCEQYAYSCHGSGVLVSCRMNYITLNATLPASPQAGTYTFWVSFGGKTYRHYFSVNCQQDLTFSGSQTGAKGFKVSNVINSTATISSNTTNNIQYHADNGVVLKAGFTATQGSTFTATTKGCTRL